MARDVLLLQREAVRGGSAEEWQSGDHMTSFTQSPLSPLRRSDTITKTLNSGRCRSRLPHLCRLSLQSAHSDPAHNAAITGSTQTSPLTSTMPVPDSSVLPTGGYGTSSFASILSPILTPPSLPSLPTTLLSARRASRRRTFDPRQQQPTAASVPSIASSSSAFSHSRGLDVLNLAVRGEPAPKATGPVTREMAGWAKQTVSAVGPAFVAGTSMGSAVEEKEADHDVESEKLRAANSRRASRHATWNHFAASSTSSSPTSAARHVLPAVNGQQSALPSAASFVATYPATSSTSSAMTVALTSMAARPPSPYSPLAGRNASADLTPLFSSAVHGGGGSAGSALEHATSDDLVKPAVRAGRRRSSLPLPASPPKLSDLASPKRQPGSSWTSQQPSSASSPSSSSPPVMSAAYVAARSRGSSAWSRSTVDRFGVASNKPADPEGEKNAWGFSELDEPPPAVRSTATAASRVPQTAVVAAQSSGSSSPRPATAGSPSSSLPPRPWNFGYVPAEEKGIRRTRNVQIDVDPHAYQQRTTTRVQQSVPHFEPIRVARPPRRRKPTDGSDEAADERPWGHWAQAGLTEEPNYPFPGRKFIFRDCPLRKSECSDSWCAKHYRRAGEAELEAEEEEPAVEERKDDREAEAAAAAAEAEMDAAAVAEDGLAAVDNMAVVRLRGASDRALKAAFARATPAYAALAKKTSKALADSTELHKAPVVELAEAEAVDDRKQAIDSM